MALGHKLELFDTMDKLRQEAPAGSTVAEVAAAAGLDSRYVQAGEVEVRPAAIRTTTGVAYARRPPVLVHDAA